MFFMPLGHLFEGAVAADDWGSFTALLKGFEFDFFITESQEYKEFHPDGAVDYLLRDLLEGTQIGFNSVHGVVSIE